jgi:hypothetical protein
MFQATQSSTPHYAAQMAMINAGIGAFTAAIFTSINPIAGAIFGATSSLGTHAINWLLDKAAIPVDNNAGRIIRFAATFFGGIAIGAILLSAVGLPLTFVGGLVLTVGMLGTAFAINLMLGTCAHSTTATL